ncbi:histidine utilization repressor [Arvimicrobium flavum]|uniref:histidine utilization repressor n=1 Tax=Arvimicrobium flavum TaxID=3393320 RepID=UPI00237BCFFE|nr:histidine utilization repressor [Mesorhizobium shangrilense]
MDAPNTGEGASTQGSLHRRILADITDKILSGAWPPGHRIPFEHVLTEEYGCSRMTVNKAMTELAKGGLIERRRRSGSFVSRPRSQAAILEIHDIATEVHALGLPYRYELVEGQRRPAASADREAIDVEEGTPLLQLTCIHFAGERAFCLEERLINQAAVPEAEAAIFSESAPGAWLIAQVPWSAAEHSIKAAAADRVVAKALDIPKGAPCLLVERRTWSGGQPITRVRLTYPGDSHTLIARFVPSQK